jgi:hypothetical protein
VKLTRFSQGVAEDGVPLDHVRVCMCRQGTAGDRDQRRRPSRHSAHQEREAVGKHRAAVLSEIHAPCSEKFAGRRERLPEGLPVTDQRRRRTPAHRLGVHARVGDELQPQPPPDVPLLPVLHGIGTATGRPLWAPEARAAVELLIAGLQAV